MDTGWWTPGSQIRRDISGMDSAGITLEIDRIQQSGAEIVTIMCSGFPVPVKSEDAINMLKDGLDNGLQKKL
jgi:hypothetical protein